MTTSVDFIEFVMDSICDLNYEFRYKKMFGEYCVYANEKPILLVCDNTVFVKMIGELELLMRSAKTDFPYCGAKQYYVLDIDDSNLCREVIKILEQNTPVPKPRKKK